jgi:hypothetical protein
MSAIVSAAAGHDGTHFLERASAVAGALTEYVGSPFLAFFVGVLTVAGAVALWIELLMREAAIYVIVLMLPLAFAALVWPARRIWVLRAIELLIALILSKFAIVAVLSLGGAALSSSSPYSITGVLAGCVLVGMAAFVPWALLRLLPIAEIASGAAGSLRSEANAVAGGLARAGAWGFEGHDWAMTAAQMRRDVDAAEPADAAVAGRDRLEALAAPVAASAASVNRAREGEAAAAGEGEAAAAGEGESTTGGESAPAPAPEAETTSANSEQLPGLAPMWQAENLHWRPFIAGFEDPKVWPPEGPAGPPTEAEPPEDADPIPDRQPSPDGHL